MSKNGSKISEKKTSSKLSSGHVSCGFDNSAENFSSKGHNSIAENRKNYEVFLGKYSIKMFRWTDELVVEEEWAELTGGCERPYVLR